MLYPDTNIKESLLILALSTSLLLISSLVLVGFVYKKMLCKVGPTEQPLQSLAVFYSVGIVMLGLNAIELISSLEIFGIFATVDTNPFEDSLLAAIKGIYIAIYRSYHCTCICGYWLEESKDISNLFMLLLLLLYSF